MKIQKTVLCGSLAVVLGSTGLAAQAAMLLGGDLLTITPGAPQFDSNGNFFNVTSGSYFMCDCDANSKIANVEKTAISPGSAGGIVVGVTQSPGEIDNYQFFGFPGGHYTTAPVTGGTTSGLNFSGWSWFWNSVSTPLNSGSWTPLNCSTAGVYCTGYSNGVARLDWSGIYGDSYTLNYAATVPLGDPSGFGGVRYFLHLEGVVTSFALIPPVPIPAAAWLFASGLVGLALGRFHSRK